jgi:Holliday junction resolvase RusA-like endonuclease
MIALTVVIPGIARGKGRPRFGNGRAYTDKATGNAEAFIRLCAAQAMQGAAPLQGALEVRMAVTVGVPASWPRKRRQEALEGVLRPTGRPDWDNVAKLASDALNGIVWLDDAQVVQATVSKHYGEAPSTVIEVKSA